MRTAERPPIAPLCLLLALALASPGKAQDLSTLIRELEEASFAQRVEAAEKLGALGAKAGAAIPALEARLYEGSSQVRKAAAAALAKIAVPAAYQTLQTALGNDSRALRRDVVAGMGTAPDRHITLLGGALQDEDLLVRERAVRGLGASSSPAALVPLSVAAARDEDSGVREQAFVGITRWFDRAEGRARIAPDQIHVALKKGLADSSERVRIEAVKAYAAVDPEGAVPRFRSLVDRATEPVRRAAFEALAGLGSPEAIRSLEAGLQSAVAVVRRDATRALAQVGAPALPSLLRALGDRSVEVRREALSGIPDPPPTRALDGLARLAHDPDVGLRREGIERISRGTPTSATREAVRRALRDEDPTVRAVGVAATGKLFGDEAPAVLEDLLLTERDGAVRRSALTLVGRQKTAAAAVLLGKVLSDPDNGASREDIFEMLLENRKFAAGPLMASLDNPDPTLQARVVELLGELGDPRVVPRVMQLLTDPQNPERLRIKAASALGKLNHEPALAVIQGLWVEGRHLDGASLATLEDAMADLGYESLWLLELRRHAAWVIAILAFLGAGLIWTKVVSPRLAARAEAQDKEYLAELERRQREPKGPPTEDEFLEELDGRLRAESSRPRVVRFLYQRALVHFIREDFESASTDLEDALRKLTEDDDPTLRAKTYFFLGKAARQRGDLQYAQRRLSEALREHDGKISQEVMSEIAASEGPSNLKENIAKIEARLPFSDDITVFDVWSEFRG